MFIKEIEFQRVCVSIAWPGTGFAQIAKIASTISPSSSIFYLFHTEEKDFLSRYYKKPLLVTFAVRKMQGESDSCKRRRAAGRKLSYRPKILYLKFHEKRILAQFLKACQAFYFHIEVLLFQKSKLHQGQNGHKINEKAEFSGKLRPEFRKDWLNFRKRFPK